MSVTMLALIGFLMVFVIVYGLMQSKVTPIPIFAIASIIAALIAVTPWGYVFSGFAGAAPANPYPQIFKHINDGVRTTMPIAVLFIFSIIYFGVMLDVGLFDPLVKFLVAKAGGNVVLVTVATGLIATVAHLDGALAATLLITCPAMLPLYKKMNIRPLVLLVIIGAAMSIMNLLPWGGPVARTAAIFKVNIDELWRSLIPLQVVGVVIVVIFSAIMGMIEKARGAGLPAGVSPEQALAEEEDPKKAALKRPHLLIHNLILTLAVLALLCFTSIPLYGAFMIGLSVALVINFPNPKDQTGRIKAHSADALGMASILLASGIFLGVLRGTKMLDAMATTLIAIIPDFMGPYLHVVMGFLSVPVGMVLGTDSFFFGLVPLATSVGQQFGIDPLNMAKWMLIGKNYGVIVTPHAATTFLAIGLAGVELKDHMRFCTPIMWMLGIISLVAALFLGIITI